jgi:hypothetical protein
MKPFVLYYKDGTVKDTSYLKNGNQYPAHTYVKYQNDWWTNTTLENVVIREWLGSLAEKDVPPEILMLALISE